MTAYEIVIDALRANGRQVTETGQDKARAQCPAHDDHNPSLEVRARKDGKGVTVTCYTGCDYIAVLDAIGLKPRDLYDDDGMRAVFKPNVDYRYPGGRVNKRRTSPDGRKRFTQTGAADRSLYLADKIPADCPLVFMVEGEKAAEAIWVMGAVGVATGGAQRSCDMTPLRGVDVVVVVDRDNAGLRWAARQKQALDGVAAAVRFMRCPLDIPKADVVEHFDNDLDLVALEEFDPSTTSYDDEPEPTEAIPLSPSDTATAEPRNSEQPEDGAALLDELVRWWGRFIAVTDPDDLYLLALWAVHTHLVVELYTTPRLLIDSIMEGSGKSTVIDHLYRLCVHPVQAASVSSPALIPRLLEYGMRTILLDEAHRALRPDRPGVEDLIGIINTGYRYGATRPVLVPTKGGGWDANEMTTFAPVAMAGNNPNLPADTVSRQIRVLLMPDIDGTVEDSDWEHIEGDARALKTRIAEWADAVRDEVRGMAVALPAGCIGRCKERWRPLARVTAAAADHWPATVHRLIEADMTQERAEREAGLRTLPPGMVMMADLYAVWPEGEPFMPTRQLVTKLIGHNPDYWGADSPYGKQLTDHRLGRLVSQASKMTSSRPDTRGPRGYRWAQLVPAWIRLGIARIQIGANGGTGGTGLDEASEGDHVADSAGLTACSALDETPTATGAQPAFTPPTGTGRCPECGLHLEIQGGHRDTCSKHPDNQPPF